jgi:hypothetical protein
LYGCLAITAIAVAIGAPMRALRAADEAADLARLSLEVQRAEDIRAVKRLQISYAHYAQFGLWSEMALLFTSDAEAVYGADHFKGRAAIRTYLLTTWGNGRDGLPAGGLHTMLEDAPVLNLSADGKTAKGRWREFSMIGQLGGHARWEQGISENEYVKEGESGRSRALTTTWRLPVLMRPGGSPAAATSSSFRSTTHRQRPAFRFRRFRTA